MSEETELERDECRKLVRAALPAVAEKLQDLEHFVCDHDGDECTCREESAMRFLLERIRKAVGEE